ncbi:MAG: ROK family protein [Planctomycetes bacterium]|nr:ROK family protein [Planctomycetota bacterium]
MTLNRIGVDLGGTKIEAAVVDSSGSVIWNERVATPSGDYEATLKAIVELVSRARPVAGAVAGVGIGTPGSENPTTGLHRNANSTCLNGKPLRADLERRLGLRVRTANDANCFALSEAIDGAAKGASVVFGVILGTGCGGGIVVHGKVLGGANGIAGEWGHTALPNPDDEERSRPACWCGRTGCLEQFLSGSAVEMDHALGAKSKRIPLTRIAALAEEGDPGATATIDRWIHRMGRAFAGIINVLDPDAIVLGGGASLVAGLPGRLPAAIRPHIFADAWSTPILPARFGDASGVRGAAWLCDTFTA